MDGELLVGGVVPLTTLDYPDRLASVVFLQGCNWRCVYCHNRHLQSISSAEALPWEEVLNLLKVRRGFVDAVVFSGGEPLLQDALTEAVQEVKALGFSVGLHTSGAIPEKLAEVVHFLDWVGFDLKCSFQDYRSITGSDGSGEAARRSLGILVSSNVDFEARITLHESIRVASVVEALKEAASMGVRTVVLQKCRDKNENIVEHIIFSDKLLLEDMSKHFDRFLIR
ncbi:MAG: anaerobic ribonucleoside-triphosphate reductase activating protein [Holosporaceae bacterium]|jgi:pyruvate formate lyase activating enzyme|nr:anaerobic ribonucleoside-triphosphate reductase activating protein [Holosporaceae bacterium]